MNILDDARLGEKNRIRQKRFELTLAQIGPSNAVRITSKAATELLVPDSAFWTQYAIGINPEAKMLVPVSLFQREE